MEGFRQRNARLTVRQFTESYDWTNTTIQGGFYTMPELLELLRQAFVCMCVYVCVCVCVCCDYMNHPYLRHISNTVKHCQYEIHEFQHGMMYNSLTAVIYYQTEGRDEYMCPVTHFSCQGRVTHIGTSKPNNTLTYTHRYITVKTHMLSPSVVTEL